jgi:hypothetical protein
LQEFIDALQVACSSCPINYTAYDDPNNGEWVLFVSSIFYRKYTYLRQPSYKILLNIFGYCDSFYHVLLYWILWTHMNIATSTVCSFYVIWKAFTLHFCCVLIYCLHIHLATIMIYIKLLTLTVFFPHFHHHINL